MELRNCLHSLEINHQEDSHEKKMADSGLISYKWLADTQTAQSSHSVLDAMTVAELTDMCGRLQDDDVITVLREIQSLAHLSTTAHQLLSQFRLLLADIVMQHEDPTNSRRMSVSGMIAGLKSFRRKNSPNYKSDAGSIEAQQTTV